MNITNLGEILTGNRAYFPEPVAYDNQRRPIIPAQLGARPMPIEVAEGMGGVPETLSYLASPMTIPRGLVLLFAAVTVFLIVDGQRTEYVLDAYQQEYEASRRRRRRK